MDKVLTVAMIGTVTLCLAATIALLAKPVPETYTPPFETTSEFSTQNSEALDVTDRAELEAMLLKQSEQISALQTHLQAIQEQSNRNSDSAIATASEPFFYEDESEPSYEEYEQQRKDRARVYSENLSSLIQERKTTEPRDASWAFAYEDDLAQSFATAFPDSAVIQNDCFTSICEIRIQHDDFQAKQQFLSGYAFALPNFDEAHITENSNHTGRPTTVINVVRDGAGEVFNSELMNRVGTEFGS